MTSSDGPERESMIKVTDAKVYLTKGKGRTLKAGGMWVYDNEIQRIEGTFENGDILEIQFGNKSVKAEILDVKDTAKKEEAKELFRYL